MPDTDSTHPTRHHSEHVDCIISGGGPAGIVAGLLLARGGVKVIVLEKHMDFFRDFRGDTIHPSTLRLLDELGLYHEFARIAHRRVEGVTLTGRGGKDVLLADFTRLDLPHPFMTIAPQWDFLNLLAKAGEDEPNFDLRMRVEATSLIWDDDRVVGLRARNSTVAVPAASTAPSVTEAAPPPEDTDVHAGERPDSTSDASTPATVEFRAPLVIAADGRWSQARAEAGLSVRKLSSTIDVWWFRIDTEAVLPDSVAPRGGNGKVFVAIPRDGHVQIARLIPKGADERLRAEGIGALRDAVAETYPQLAADVGQVEFDDVKLLDVRRNEARRWFTDGLLCIGDSAHAMSPLGGVGVNLAVQDGIAVARTLAEPLRAGSVRTAELRRLQLRRLPTTRAVELLQSGIHRMVEPAVHGHRPIRPPAPVEWLLTTFPALTRIPARILGVGITAEHAPDFARREEPTFEGTQ
ncbi:FAD-dependent oxidoreductase [Brevibacterium linens]|uniref:2-polyprenyl-6-methoxyphenol hydroxylase n=2 Tax=Brevibacterium linens TaxID=1703 RepID=A0A2H1K3F4_BRELN|nr:FAD-dependent oxidoreductase [Brevibacterium linens]SMX82235.1 2-polyprenyl-6-methoxyphenol hydroxylase [Brevibacterium linens ATCC 9172]SMX94236.1 2-polyprenyl-6-methoxyphenol hydroxylase [Brevibacterium linens]